MIASMDFTGSKPDSRSAPIAVIAPRTPTIPSYLPPWTMASECDPDRMVPAKRRKGSQLMGGIYIIVWSPFACKGLSGRCQLVFQPFQQTSSSEMNAYTVKCASSRKSIVLRQPKVPYSPSLSPRRPCSASQFNAYKMTNRQCVFVLFRPVTRAHH